MRKGLKKRAGTLTIGGDHVDGTEEVYFVANSGDGDELCRVRYDLTETSQRDDCDDCLWAVELEVTNAEVVGGFDESCSVLGAADGNASNLNGHSLVYGYNDDYFGHAEVLYVFSNEDGWQPLGFAELDDLQGTLSYGATEGEHEY